MPRPGHRRSRRAGAVVASTRSCAAALAEGLGDPGVGGANPPRLKQQQSTPRASEPISATVT
eukprot:5329177-Pyramimonas_sp.AAC.1